MIIALVLISVGSDNGTDISVVPGSLQFVVEGVEPVTKSAIRSAIRRLASDDTAVDSILAALVDVVVIAWPHGVLEVVGRGGVEAAGGGGRGEGG